MLGPVSADRGSGIGPLSPTANWYGLFGRATKLALECHSLREKREQVALL